MATLGLGASLAASAGAQQSCTDCDVPPACRDSSPSKASQANCQTLEITIDSDINFGRLVLMGEGDGKVLLDLNTGEKRTVGEISDLGGLAMSGTARIIGAPNQAIKVNLPTSVTMSDGGGTRAELRDVSTDLPALPMLDMDGQLEFRFSGTLVTNADTASGGKLRGRVPISVEYQ